MSCIQPFVLFSSPMHTPPSSFPPTKLYKTSSHPQPLLPNQSISLDPLQTHQHRSTLSSPSNSRRPMSTPMAKQASSSASKWRKYLKAPIRALGKARDFYVRSLTDCAGSMGPGLYPNTLPKSFSVASSRVSTDDEDMREVMRMLTQRSLREKLEAAVGGRGRIPAAGGKDGLPKSFSVAIGRIDEDKPYYGEGDVKVELYPRSRSHAVSMRRSGMFTA